MGEGGELGGGGGKKSQIRYEFYGRSILDRIPFYDYTRFVLHLKR